MDSEDVKEMIKDLTNRGMLDEDTEVRLWSVSLPDPEESGPEQVYERVYALFTPDEIELLKATAEAFEVPVSTAMRMMVLGYMQISTEMALVTDVS